MSRVVAHVLLLMESLAASLTGKAFRYEEFRDRLENLWRAGSSAKIDSISEICSELKSLSNLNVSQVRTSEYLRLKSLLQSLPLLKEAPGQPQRHSGDITYPASEVSMARCSMLTVRGTGSEGLYCVVELPDGGVELAKPEMQSCGWTAHVRLPCYAGQTYVQVSLAALVDSIDVLKGYGLYHPTIKHILPFVPVSRPHQILISPK
jgi:hypothetical protein